ncbi:MAG: helix-turn-helix domain-containing protein [Propionibacteriaceae bacterium]|jgi:HTH-type transcriptional regulator/antitoxin HipB|nr:helix-turn-helix domain-containing protein [Propionibacteriaceae bacterium]
MILNNARDVGLALRKGRADKGWTQQRLASMLGVTRQWVASVEAGAPTARLGLVIDALRCVDILVETKKDDTSQAILDQVFGRR